MSVPVAAAAQAAFDGTWKADLASAQMPQKPDVYLLKDGVYQCKTCAPPVEVKADGADHPVTGHPYYDSVAIKAVNAHTVLETDKKDGRVVTTSTTTLSPDGRTLTYVFSDSSNSKTPVTGKVIETRVAEGPAGAHPLSGSWRATKVEGVSDNGLTVSFKVEGDTLKMSAPTGQSYAARIDGPEAPFKGDPGVTSVSIRRLDAHTLEETDRRDGNVVAVVKMTVAPPGKTLQVAVDNKLQGTTMSYTAAKQ
jgi:hypothetical protein